MWKTMKTKEEIKQALEEALNQVIERLSRLDMIEERLLRMKQLAQRVITEDLTEDEIKDINKQVNDLREQVSLLDREATSLS